MCLGHAFSLTHSFPLVADVLGGEVGVGVDSRQLDSVGLSDLQDLAVDAQRGHALLVSLGQGGLELVVSGDQTLEGSTGAFQSQTGQQEVYQLLHKMISWWPSG